MTVNSVNHNPAQAGYELVERQIRVANNNQNTICHTYTIDPSSIEIGQLKADRYRFQDNGLIYLGSKALSQSQVFLASELSADYIAARDERGLVLRSYWQPGRYNAQDCGMRRPIISPEWRVHLLSESLSSLKLEERLDGDVINQLSGAFLVEIAEALKRPF